MGTTQPGSCAMARAIKPVFEQTMPRGAGPTILALSDAEFKAKLSELSDRLGQNTLSLSELCLLDLMQTLRPHLAEEMLT